MGCCLPRGLAVRGCKRCYEACEHGFGIELVQIERMAGPVGK